MKKILAIILLVPLGCFHLGCSKNKTTEPSRSFYMGVTPWPADFTIDEVTASYDFINSHCDIVSHHFDEGVPYEEAYNNSGWPVGLSEDISIRKTKTAAGKKILLSSSALALNRKQKAPYSRFSASVSDAVKNNWELLPVNDARVITAYSNYIIYLAQQLHPSFINYGVESNFEEWDAAGFAMYKDFLRQVFERIKIAYPSLPIMVSFMVSENPQSLPLAQQLLPYTDYIALSAYPYIHVSSTANGNTNPSLFPADLFARYANLDVAKPFCFAETGFIAEGLVVPSFSLNKLGKPQWQNDYLIKICNLMNERKGKFIIWFCSKDYDAGNNTLRSLGQYQDLFALWEDTGLIDENNNQRPAYTTWLAWKGVKKSE